MSTPVIADVDKAGRVPPLANGDWLKRDEFHQRYLAMGGVKKAELIQGDFQALLAAVQRGTDAAS